jgi:carbonic anhydrase/acetyltransferase-like protein (isoleucine patch superfamily)
MIYMLADRTMETCGDDYYVAPGAQVIGSVRLGAGASVWFNCVVRADNDSVVIGEGTNIQDGTIIHSDAGVPVVLASNVSVGHRALLHGCTIGENSLVANGAIILDGVVVGRNCLIAAGALVPPGKIIPDGSVVMGIPGKVIRQTDERDIKLFAFTAAHYRERGRLYRNALVPDPRGTPPRTIPYG